MELHTIVPIYTVRVAEHLRAGIWRWTQMQRTGFLKEVDALGASNRTRNLRHAGGQATWLVVGGYHMTYTADPHTKTITVVAARPCTHIRGECPA